MTVAKVIEICAESDRKFRGAIARGVKTAAKPVRNVRKAWVQEQKVEIDEDRIVSYRVNLKVPMCAQRSGHAHSPCHGAVIIDRYGRPLQASGLLPPRGRRETHPTGRTLHD